MRLAFLGTPEFAVPALAELIEAGHEFAAVYSQPAAPRGRGQATTPSAVHAFAETRGLPVRTPPSLGDPTEAERFAALDLDAVVVVAFGQILPAAILTAPRLGAFNLHASLLPRWRGAAPIQRAIMAGDTVTGATVMRMTEGLDEGPIMAATEVDIGTRDTAGTLHDRLAIVGARLMAEALAAVSRGAIAEVPQTEVGITYARKIRASETSWLAWNYPAEQVDRRIRGLSPFPGAWLTARSSRGPVRIKALLSQVEPGAGTPGGLLDDDFLIACGEGAVRILRAQREGRAAQASAEFLRGFPVAAGTRLV